MMERFHSSSKDYLADLQRQITDLTNVTDLLKYRSLVESLPMTAFQWSRTITADGNYRHWNTGMTAGLLFDTLGAADGATDEFTFPTDGWYLALHAMTVPLTTNMRVTSTYSQNSGGLWTIARQAGSTYGGVDNISTGAMCMHIYHWTGVTGQYRLIQGGSSTAGGTALLTAILLKLPI